MENIVKVADLKEKKAIALEFGFGEDVFSGMMLALHHLDYSDISIVTGKPIWAKRHGRMEAVTNRTLQDSEVRFVISSLYGANAVAEISKGAPLDKRYEIRADESTCFLANRCIKMLGHEGKELKAEGGEGRRVPFRMNAAGAYTQRGSGIAISLRTIPITLPHIDNMSLPQNLRDSINIEKGMCLVVGETGSGKSTLLASVMREKLENSDNRKLITIEAPIEFDLQGVKCKNNLVVQHEVGPNLPSFYQGIVNSLRQAPTDILVGEARDQESIEAVIRAVETGHATYTTVHAASVSGTFRRIAAEFGVNAQAQIIFQLVSHVRVVVVQRLALSKHGGKRIPIREWLVFEEEFKDKLLRLSPDEVLNAIDDEVKRQGQSIRQQIMKAFKEDEITFRDVISVTGLLTNEERAELQPYIDREDAQKKTADIPSTPSHSIRKDRPNEVKPFDTASQRAPEEPEKLKGKMKISEALKISPQVTQEDKEVEHPLRGAAISDPPKLAEFSRKGS